MSRRFLAKLDAARAALSHKKAGASTEAILEAALDLLLAQDARRKGATDRPRPEPRPSKPDHVPAHVRRAVWARDGGRCQWPLACGGVCGSTHRLQYDHVEPLARGGASTVENVRLLCATHNQVAARHAFGDAWMDQFTRAARRPRRGDADARPTLPAASAPAAPPAAGSGRSPAPSALAP